MKKLGCALLVLAVPVLLFLGLAGFAILGIDDQSPLEDDVDVTVLETRDITRGSSGGGWDVRYAYRAQGRWYGGDDWISNDFWEPGAELVACVDPEDPAQHVLKVNASQQCGDETIGGGIATGTPTTPPNK